MKTYGGGSIAPPFLTSALDESDWSDSRFYSFTHKKEPAVPLDQKAGRAQESDWNLWDRGKLLAPAWSWKLKSLDFHSLYASWDIIKTIIKWRRIRWTENVAYTERKGIIYWILVQECEVKTPAVISECRLEASIWINLEEAVRKSLIWVNLARDSSMVGQCEHRNNIFISVIIRTEIVNIYIITVACLLGNATNNLWVLDLTLDSLDTRQAKLQLIITLSIYCNYKNA
jgi:hypothetical protein